MQDAGYQCLDECEYFPKPADITKRIKLLKKDKAHDIELKDHFKCPVCSCGSSIMIGGVCWYCYNKVPLSVSRPKLKPFIPPDANFTIQTVMKCQTCGKMGVCIQEPINSAPWECRECFTGLTLGQYKEKIYNIINQIGR